MPIANRQSPMAEPGEAAGGGRNSPVRRTGAGAQFVAWRDHLLMSKSSGGHKFPRRRTGAPPEAVINIRIYRLTVVKRGGGRGGGARYADIGLTPLSSRKRTKLWVDPFTSPNPRATGGKIRPVFQDGVAGGTLQTQPFVEYCRIHRTRFGSPSLATDTRGGRDKAQKVICANSESTPADLID